MKITTYIAFLISYLLLFSFCNNAKTTNRISESDSLFLLKMVDQRVKAMQNKDFETAIDQFSENATYINSSGYLYCGKEEIEAFHKGLVPNDLVNYSYTAGKTIIKSIDNNNAIVYFTWKMDFVRTYHTSDTLLKEKGLMSLSAQKQNAEWKWVAVTNQHTPVFYEDFSKNRKK